MARAVVRGEIERGVAIRGSGVGACVVANKAPGIRACLIHEMFSARQGVEDDDLNVICLGGLVVGQALAWELLTTFLGARFSGVERNRRRLAKAFKLPRVYLVRHGETVWTLTAQHTGRSDLPLTEQGEQQAREPGPRRSVLGIDRICSSPLQRARRIAELAMPHSRVEADDDLMKWDYGAYEGRPTTEIEIDRPGWHLFRDGCPNGETLHSVGARADGVIGRITPSRSNSTTS